MPVVLLRILELGHASLDVTIFVADLSLIFMHVVTSLSGSLVNLLHMHVAHVRVRVHVIVLGIYAYANSYLLFLEL